MRGSKLDGRLSLCAEFVREGSRLLDIGTDHGYLPIYLVRSGRIPSALACDINPSPLSSADINIHTAGLSGRIKTRLSDGLAAVSPDEGDDIVIAGMGGELIARILADCPWVKSPKYRLILQPMTKYELLAGWLYDNGFEITRQKAAFADGKYYTVLECGYTGVRRSADLYECCLGALDTDDETSRLFLLKTAGRLRKQAIGDPSVLPCAEKIEGVIHND